MRERLIELLNFVKCNAECCASLDGGRCGELDYLDRCQIEAIADHLLADGWIRLPCKVGDVVYEIVHGEILETEAVGFLVCQDGTILMITKYSFPLTREIGCCLFLTREEAEQGLNNIENGNS